MTIQLLKPIDVEGAIIPAGEVVKIHDPETAKEMIRQGIGYPVNQHNESLESEVLYRNPFPQGSPEARAESLRIMGEATDVEGSRPVSLADTLDKILQQTIDDIQVGGNWKTTGEVREIESQLDKIYREVLTGARTIEAFQSICWQWRNAGTCKQEKESPAGGQWDESMAGLIQWFSNATLPEQPFSVSPYEHILCPEKYYEAMRRDIAAGPRGARSRYGVLQSDLQRLKDYCEGRRGDA